MSQDKPTPAPEPRKSDPGKIAPAADDTGTVDKTKPVSAEDAKKSDMVNLAPGDKFSDRDDKGAGTDAQKAVGMSVATQLDPSIAGSTDTLYADNAHYNHPETRGLVTGKELKEYFEKKAKGDADADMTPGDVVVPQAVQDAHDRGVEINEERAKQTTPTSPPAQGQPTGAGGPQGKPQEAKK